MELFFDEFSQGFFGRILIRKGMHIFPYNFDFSKLCRCCHCIVPGFEIVIFFVTVSFEADFIFKHISVKFLFQSKDIFQSMDFFNLSKIAHNSPPFVVFDLDEFRTERLKQKLPKLSGTYIVFFRFLNILPFSPHTIIWLILACKTSSFTSILLISAIRIALTNSLVRTLVLPEQYSDRVVYIDL